MLTTIIWSKTFSKEKLVSVGTSASSSSRSGFRQILDLANDRCIPILIASFYLYWGFLIEVLSNLLIILNGGALI